MAYIKFSKDTTINMILDEQAGEGLCRIREKVAKDIERTTGASVQTDANGDCGQAVLAATLGEGTLADALAEKIPELKTLSGRWHDLRHVPSFRAAWGDSARILGRRHAACVGKRASDR